MSNGYSGMHRAFEDDPAAETRCAERLLGARVDLQKLRAERSDDSLLLATWNLRDFDSNKFGFGPRLPESFYYIAEIVSCFDLVALQEVNRDLSPLRRLTTILGHEWDYLVTDTTEGSRGNGERMAFLYNKEKVNFRKIAGEVVLPNGQLVVASKAFARKAGATDGQQFARSPFLVAFQAGWFRFSLCTVHIFYGSEKGAELARRVGEIDALVKFFANRQDREVKADRVNGAKSPRSRPQFPQAENYILLGDFNVVSPEHQTMRALVSHGFTVPDAIDGANVRGPGQHFYDQIAVRVKDARFQVTGGGILDVYQSFFRDADHAAYRRYVPPKDLEKNGQKARTPEDLYKKWRTWQMSDHNPLWIKIATNFTDDYLRRIAKATANA